MAPGAWPRGVLLAALCGGLVLSGGAQAQDDGAAKLRRQIDAALANIEHARCGNKEFCAPATEAETAAPPVTAAEGAEALERGAISGFAQACNLDWRALSYQPMLERWRKGGKSERQIALMGILHGMGFGETQAAIGNRPCTERLRQDIRTQLSTLP